MSNINQFLNSSSRADILNGLFASGDIFGSGEDGDDTTSGTEGGSYLDIGSMQYANLTIPAAQTIATTAGDDNGGIFIRVSNTLTIAGSLTCNGAAGGDAASNASGAGGAGAGGAAAEASVTGDTVGGDGNTPASVAGAGASGGSGACANTVGSLAGGKPRRLYSSITVGQLSVINLSAEIGFRGIASALGTGRAYDTAADDATVDFTDGTYQLQGTSIRGAGGGGGGGANFDTEAAAGGGGGGGAGAIVISARHIVFTAGHSIECDGGAGGAGWAAGAAGDAGGGAGGNGGFVLIVCESYTGTPTITVDGGAGGAKVNSGVAGSAGSAGQYKVMQVKA